VHKLFIKTQNKTRAITTLQTSDGENAAEIKEKRGKAGKACFFVAKNFVYGLGHGFRWLCNFLVFPLVSARLKGKLGQLAG